MNRAEKRRQKKLAKKAASNAKFGKATIPSPGQQTPTIQQSLELAVRHHNAGDLAKAEGIYQQVLQADPNQPVALHLLGVIAHQVGKNDIAVDLIGKALAIKPDYVEAHTSLGNTLQRTGRLEDAVASYHKALAIKPDFANAHSNLGNVLRELGKLDEAVASYNKALAIKPDLAEIHNNLGVALQELGKLDEAVASYNKAIAIKPDYAEAHSNLGVALQKLGKLDEAVASYHKAIAIRPDDAEAHSNLGNAFKDLGKLDEAVASYHKALIIKPDFAEAHNNLGTTFQMLERIEDALASYDLAQLPGARAKILECLFALGRYEDFYRELERLIKTESTNLRAAAISAFASQQLGHDDPYPFCKDPLDFVRVGRVCDSAEDTADLMDELVEDLRPRNAIWEPPWTTTKFGFQTRDNLFADPKGSLAKLDRIIKSEIESYYSEFKFANCLFMASWPSQIRLNGWFVRLLGHGHQDDHIHPGGWLSGVIYLKVPKTSNLDEGAIEFGLHGYKYPLLNEEYPRTLHRPEKGQIVLFPSSLFHRTVPISADDERLSIAFDLIPA